MLLFTGGNLGLEPSHKWYNGSGSSVHGFDRIRSSLPPGYEMRLPADITLGDAVLLETEGLIVRVFPSTSPRLTVADLPAKAARFRA